MSFVEGATDDHSRDRSVALDANGVGVFRCGYAPGKDDGYRGRLSDGDRSGDIGTGKGAVAANVGVLHRRKPHFSRFFCQVRRSDFRCLLPSRHLHKSVPCVDGGDHLCSVLCRPWGDRIGIAGEDGPDDGVVHAGIQGGLQGVPGTNAAAQFQDARDGTSNAYDRRAIVTATGRRVEVDKVNTSRAGGDEALCHGDRIFIVDGCVVIRTLTQTDAGAADYIYRGDDNHCAIVIVASHRDNPGMNLLEKTRRDYIHRHGESALIDLTSSDFRRAGIHPSEDLYRTAFARWRNDGAYRPSGLGAPALREVIHRYLVAEGNPISSDNIVVTSGSSISYFLIFQCMRRTGTTSGWSDTHGDRKPLVALPRPGYPLFEELALDAGMGVRWYHLSPERGFQPDPAEIEALLQDGVGAVILISPGNPTGVVTDPAMFAAVDELCARYGALLIIDEVFSRFAAPRENPAVPYTFRSLTIRLNGLSKLAAAPEIKLGWIAVTGGDTAAREAAVATLDTIHDTYLTASGFAEAAGQVFLDTPEGRAGLDDIQQAVLERRRSMDEMLRTIPVLEHYRGASVPGGIHYLLKLDPVTAAGRFGTVDDEQIACQLIDRAGVLVHPGYLYGMEDAFPGRGPWFVITGLHDKKTIATAGKRLRNVLGVF